MPGWVGSWLVLLCERVGVVNSLVVAMVVAAAVVVVVFVVAVVGVVGGVVGVAVVVVVAVMTLMVLVVGGEEVGSLNWGRRRKRRGEGEAEGKNKKEKSRKKDRPCDLLLIWLMTPERVICVSSTDFNPAVLKCLWATKQTSNVSRFCCPQPLKG